MRVFSSVKEFLDYCSNQRQIIEEDRQKLIQESEEEDNLYLLMEERQVDRPQVGIQMGTEDSQICRVCEFFNLSEAMDTAQLRFEEVNKDRSRKSFLVWNKDLEEDWDFLDTGSFERGRRYIIRKIRLVKKS